MKREYFTALFLFISVVLILTADYIFGSEIVVEKIHRFIVIWILLAFFLGQYSTKFPKAFK
jgi:hypothetical protein